MLAIVCRAKRGKDARVEWYLSRDGQAWGPMSAEAVRQAIKDKRVGWGDHVRQHGTQEWTQLEQSVFKDSVPLPWHRSAAVALGLTVIGLWPAGAVVLLRSTQSAITRVGGAFLISWFGFAFTVIAFKSLTEPKPEPELAPASVAAPDIVQTPQPAERGPTLGNVSDLDSAVALLRDSMTDHAGSEVSATAGILAAWLLVNYSPAQLWGRLDQWDDTARAEVVKDPTPFRGSKLCSRGSITQIHTDRSLGSPIYYGVLDTGVLNIIRFVAVGSSEGVVEGSVARFCGVIIGLHSYPNVMGGQITGVEVVGAFDLPENR